MRISIVLYSNIMVEWLTLAIYYYPSVRGFATSPSLEGERGLNGPDPNFFPHITMAYLHPGSGST